MRKINEAEYIRLRADFLATVHASVLGLSSKPYSTCFSVADTALAIARQVHGFTLQDLESAREVDRR